MKPRAARGKASKRPRTTPPEDVRREIEALLDRCAQGDSKAQSALFLIAYSTLRAMAARQMIQQRPGHTLQPTALVHEAYIRLVPNSRGFTDYAHFVAFAASAMRTVLVDAARRRTRKTRTRTGTRIDFDEVAISGIPENVDIVALHECLKKLEASKPLAAQVVVLRFFGGMSFDDIARVLEVKPRKRNEPRKSVTARTVERYWKTAKVILLKCMGGRRE